MNEAFKLLFDQVKSGIVWMQRNGAVRYANKAAVQMTPVMLGQPMMDPVAERTVKAAGQDMLTLPFSFELTTQEAHPDPIRAALLAEQAQQQGTAQQQAERAASETPAAGAARSVQQGLARRCCGCAATASARAAD